MKVKVKVKTGKSGSGTLIARVPVTVSRTAHPQGKPFYQTKAQISIRPKTTRNGQPRG